MISSPEPIYSEINYKHSDQHQRFLDEQLDWLTVDHDDLMQKLVEHISTPKYHPSMAVIDKWEKEAMACIQRTAFLARRTIIDALDQHVIEVKKTLNTLTPKLRKARYRAKPFNETNLQAWASLIQELKKMPMFPVTVDKNNNIHGLTVDLRKTQQIPHSDSSRLKSKSRSLVSVVRHTSSSSPSIIQSQKTEGQIVPTLSLTNVNDKGDIEKKRVRFKEASSHGSQTVTPGGVIIIREQENDEVTTPYIRPAHAEIPSDTRTYFPLRWPRDTHR